MEDITTTVFFPPVFLSSKIFENWKVIYAVPGTEGTLLMHIKY
jgi:hypothetical protein